MTALEICLIVVGLAAIAIGYVISDKQSQEKLKRAASDYILSDDTKENLKKQTKQVVEEVLENMSGDISERTEVELEKISNQKIMAVNDYSDTVLNEINKNHNEVMFLYSMLDDKDKEIKATVREVQSTARSIKQLTTQAEQMTEVQKEQMLQLETRLEKEIEEKVETRMRDQLGRHLGKQAANLCDMADEESEKVEIGQSEEDFSEQIEGMEEEKELNFLETEEPEKIEIQPQDVETYDKGNHDIILKLYQQNKSVVEIAKELGLGVGEVKLVIDLNSSIEMNS